MASNCHASTNLDDATACDNNVVLVGNPNSGKTTVFNALTGLRQKVGNYPGVTVEKKTGSMTDNHGRVIKLHDLPGLYSLIPKSLDDKISVDILTGRSPHLKSVKLIVLVADASNLNRSLYLITQITELGAPVVLALNMMDAAESKGTRINTKEMANELGVEVLPVVAKKGQGIAELRSKIIELLAQEKDKQAHTALPVTDAVQQAAQPVGEYIQRVHGLSVQASLAEAYRIISNDNALQGWLSHTNGRKQDATELSSLATDARAQLDAQSVTWQMLETNSRYRLVDHIFQKAVQPNLKQGRSHSEKVDIVLTHRLVGPLIFVAILALIFQSIFLWAEIPTQAIESVMVWLGQQAALILPEGILQDLILDGAIAGVGAVLVFMPQIMFLFFFLSLLEDSGYMARAAFIFDRFMRAAGLSGRSVIPLLSSFACAIPGIMATRTIQSSRDRIITIMIAPFMSCSARLPVYALMIGAFIPPYYVLGIFSLPALTLLSMYMIGILAALGTAVLLKKLTGRQTKESSFVMELPPYRLPSLRWTSLQMWERAKIFVTDAGKIIFAMSIVLWALAYFPRPDNPNEVSGSTAIRQSYAGRLGQAMEPVIRPLGFDWKMGIGLITSFAAREVMVSTMATIYNVEGGNETSVTLREALKRDRDPITGQAVYTPLVALSLMVFFVLACQCMSTVAIVKRETNSWRWPVTMIVYMTVMAYIGSFIVYQGGKILGLG